MMSTECVVIQGTGPCGRAAAISGTPPIAMCRAHRTEAANARRSAIASAVESAANVIDGWVYLARVPAGHVMIGHTTDLPRRLRELRQRVGAPVWVVALVRGGRTLEARFHKRFATARVVGLLGEQFALSPELAALIATVGIDPAGRGAIDAYTKTSPRVSVPDPDYSGTNPSAVNDQEP